MFDAKMLMGGGGGADLKQAALAEMMKEDTFENPASQGEMSELLIARSLFPKSVKQGDSVVIKANVGKLGSKVSVTPYEVVSESGEEMEEETEVEI